MKLLNYVIAVYSFVSSAIFSFVAFYALFSGYLVDWIGVIYLFVFPISFSILLYYTGFGLWTDKKWAHLIGGPTYLGLGLSSIIASCHHLLWEGILFIAVSIYFFYLASKDLKA